jgi:hypothetical protein
MVSTEWNLWITHTDMYYTRKRSWPRRFWEREKGKQRLDRGKGRRVGGEVGWGKGHKISRARAISGSE